MTLRVTIKRLWDETPEVRCFELQPADGQSLPRADPGAHIDVHLDGGLLRQYSLWNGPEDTQSYFIGVKREPASRGGSAAMHRLKEGQTLSIGEPRNNFPLADLAGASLLMAGGIGITPLLSMARSLKARNRPVRLHIFARSRILLPFSRLVVDDPATTCHLAVVPPQLNSILQHLLDRHEQITHLYVCGPKPFMDLVQATAAEMSWPDAQVHFEYFTADAPAARAGDNEFEVVLNRSGRTLIVRKDQTIIQAMAEAGIDILTSCEQGVCGTCVTPVIAGEPDHRDVYLNVVEHASGKMMTPCVSRCKGQRLVLDF